MEGKSLETLIVDWLNGGYEAFYYRTSIEFQQMVSLEQFINLSKSFNDKVSSYHLKYRTSILDSFQYIWIDDKSEKAVVALVDQSDTITAFYLKPYIVYPETDQNYTTNKYIMPVEGEWFVFWGGTNKFVNYHYTFESQRYAYDLVKVQNGVSYKDNPFLNQLLCF